MVETALRELLEATSPERRIEEMAVRIEVLEQKYSALLRAHEALKLEARAKGLIP